MTYRFRAPLATLCSGILPVVVLALSGCATPDMPPMEPASGALRTTPYPYNTDLHGADLPVEIGRFDAPAVRGAADDGQVFELGFLRYPAADSANGPPIVFLLDEQPNNAVSQTLIVRLRQLGDVVLFNRRGYGFSSPPPPCPTRLNYPFDEPLTQARLTGITRAHAERCLDALVEEGWTPAMFAPREIGEDIRLLSRILEAPRLRLVAAAGMTRPVLDLIQTSPELVSKAVLINPPESTAPRMDESPAEMTTLDAFAARLQRQPVEVDYRTRSGRSIALRIGELDLAFLRSGLYQDSEPGQKAVIAAAESALKNDYDGLADLVLEMRQQLGEPTSIRFLTGADAGVCAVSTVPASPLAYAAGWPGSATGRLHETPCPAANAVTAAGIPDASKRILIIDGNSIDEDTQGSPDSVIPAFLAGKPVPDY